MALFKYLPLGGEFMQKKKLYLNRLHSWLLRYFFQILNDVDRPSRNGDPKIPIVNQHNTDIATKYFKPLVTFF